MIHGRKTRLRPIEPSDLEFLRELFNDRHVASNVVGWDFPVSLHAQQRWLDAGLADTRSRRFLIESFDGDRIGMTGLWDLDWRNRTAVTGLKLYVPTCRGKGYGADVIFTVMAYAFYDVGLNKLWATILDFNAASLRAFVGKCGWKIEGCLRQEIFRNGRFHDQFRVGILRSEFDVLPEAREYVERICPVDTESSVEVPAEWWQALSKRVGGKTGSPV